MSAPVGPKHEKQINMKYLVVLDSCVVQVCDSLAAACAFIRLCLQANPHLACADLSIIAQ